MADDDYQDGLTRRLVGVQGATLAAELEQRGYRLDLVDGSAAAGDPAFADSSLHLGHFPDKVLIAAARKRGFEVHERKVAADHEPQSPDAGELKDELSDTFTRDEMELAYKEMLELRRKRKG